MRKGACCGPKAVLVTVFVERPRRRVSSNPNQLIREPQIRHPITQTLLPRTDGRKGYDRRAELLRYSQGLRESARSTSSTPKHSTPVPHKQQATTKILVIEKKHRHSSLQTCLGNLKISMPSLLKSSTVSRRNKEKRKKKHSSGSQTIKLDDVIMNSFKGKKKQGFVSAFLSKFSKRWDMP